MPLTKSMFEIRTSLPFESASDGKAHECTSSTQLWCFYQRVCPKECLLNNSDRGPGCSETGATSRKSREVGTGEDLSSCRLKIP